MSPEKKAAVCLRYTALYALASVSLLSSSLASANTPPTISGTPATSVIAAHYYTFQPSARDPDHDTLTFSISNKPSWASFKSSTGQLYGTPIPPRDVGSFGNIVICVSDRIYRRCLPALTLKVLALPNIPPVISGTPATMVTAGSAYSFQPGARDANGLRMHFGVSNKPSWLSFDSATGRLYGTPTAAEVGTYGNIVISVSDGYYQAHLPAFSITVNSQGTQLPPGALTITWTPPTQNTDGSTLTNLAGYRIYYGMSQSNLDHVVDLTNPGLASYVLSNLSAGTWYLALTSVNTAGAEGPRSTVASAVVQ